jgi:hypothetical protein
LNRGPNRGFTTLSGQAEIVPVTWMNPLSTMTVIVIGNISSGYVVQKTTCRGFEVRTITIVLVFD